MGKLVFVDTEIDLKGNIVDLGAITDDEKKIHTKSQKEFSDFILGYPFIVGHNIVLHDSKYLEKFLNKVKKTYVDTLWVSPLIFPEKPYHKLLKDEKLNSDELNNPLSDSIKCRDLFYDEINEYNKLDKSLKSIYGTLLAKDYRFSGFFQYVQYKSILFLKKEIKERFRSLICENADLSTFIQNHPIELAYALSLISISGNPKGRDSITPPWINKNLPMVEVIIKKLRGTPCGCNYCKQKFDAKKRLKDIFDYDDFRLFDNEPLQENAVKSAINSESLLAIFPTGGGKSITFQLPALIAGETEHALSIVISPLQSLMKDQVDGLEKNGSSDAVTINGMLSPVERAESIEQVKNGKASILYLAPESLRSKTIEKIIVSRNISRFVIDEAHCFSSWGQDFRVDYQYIGDFINKIQEEKGVNSIPVSCFTATAKQKVVSDIMDYFKEKCDLSLKIFSTKAQRKNLSYKVLPKQNDDEKYQTIRDLITEKNCPTIVFVSSISKTITLSEHLVKDGFKALAFNGQMDRKEKIANQNAFMNNECQVMIATNAFGMGVDKADVKLVIHYDISDSLENYIQEAGRAGRNQSLEAECYVLFCEDDLNKHFSKLNQTKLTINEIQQVWQAIKKLSKNRQTITYSALEIARSAGWDEKQDLETRVKTAINALENSGYIKRGMNSPKVFATSIVASNLMEAKTKASNSNLFDQTEMLKVTRILSLLISSRSVKNAQNEDAEERVDYIADRLGIDKQEVITIIDKLRQANVLADDNDMTATLDKSDTFNKSSKTLLAFSNLERFMVKNIEFESSKIDLRDLNEKAMTADLKGVNIAVIRTILHFWKVKGYIQTSVGSLKDIVSFNPLFPNDEISIKIEKRLALSDFILEYLSNKSDGKTTVETISFSVVELVNEYNNRQTLFAQDESCGVTDVQDSLLYLSKIDCLNIEGGFLVLYSGLQITRLEKNNSIKYKNDDYKSLENYYNTKIQQIHIVGEYANMMVKDYQKALDYVSDYFNMDYNLFINKYFIGRRKSEITKNMTPSKYKEIFGELSPIQKEIIDDNKSKCISIIAGPGSGKTRVLVHKLASLLLLEDVKPEQLLMLTFSHQSSIEFKTRLLNLIGKQAYYVDIKTFHSYCFDLLGKNGNKEQFDDVVQTAVDMINNDEVEKSKITKTVIVIDEAQDMDATNYKLIEALLEKNENLKIIAVGDDDQNIYEFRESNSKYMGLLISNHEAKRYELLQNYRSVNKIVNFANLYSQKITQRLKTNPIVSMWKEEGVCAIVKHKSENMEEAIVKHIFNRSDRKNIAVLTNTNNEALKVMGVLLKYNIPAKLIQSNDGFELYNLAEIRSFLKSISTTPTPIVSENDWMAAKVSLKKTYKNSSILLNILNILEIFEKMHDKYYLSDFIEYVKEAKYENFLFDSTNKIVVSTIHKAKGHEFDSVYILANQPNMNVDSEIRKYYVGITRAKNELYFHLNNNSLDKYKNIEGIEFVEDDKQYNIPEILVCELSHSDVVLSYFKDKKNHILSARPGESLDFEDVYLMYKNKRVVKFSKKCVDYFDKMKELGYEITKAEIRFIVSWKGEDDECESAIILPNIYAKYTGTKNDN